MTAKRGETRNLLLQPVWAGISGTEAQGGLGTQARIEGDSTPCPGKGPGSAHGLPPCYESSKRRSSPRKWRTRSRRRPGRVDSGDFGDLDRDVEEPGLRVETVDSDRRLPLVVAPRSASGRSATPCSPFSRSLSKPPQSRRSDPQPPGSSFASHPPINVSSPTRLRGEEGERGVGKGLPVPPISSTAGNCPTTAPSPSQETWYVPGKHQQEAVIPRTPYLPLGCKADPH